MKTATLVTHEIDDLDLAVAELADGVKDAISLETSSVGIVYCDADTDVAELGRLLHEALGFDIIGLTTTALIDRHHGYCDMNIMLTVVTGDDIEVAAACSGDLSIADYAKQIEDAYNTARARISENPKLIITCTPYIAELSSENYVEVLDSISGHVPIFGGVATDHYDLKYQKTFFNGEEYTHGLTFILLAGNIKPVFAMKHDFGGGMARKGIITQSSENIIERVDGQAFKAWLSEITDLPKDELVVYHFQSTPFIIERPDYEEMEEPVVSVINALGHDAESGTFLSKMPLGSKICINVIQRDNIAASCANTLDSLIEAMESTQDYEYSLILISTCNGRHLLMGGNKDLEASIVQEKLSRFDPRINAVGFYGFGEMCPTIVSGEGKVKNRFHNISFAACAI